MPRKIKIYLEQRSIEDSPILLDRISDSFKDDEILIKVNPSEEASKVPEESNVIKDEILEIESNDIAKRALEKNEELHWDNKPEKLEEDDLKKRAQEVKGELVKEGMKVSVGTVLKVLIEALLT